MPKRQREATPGSTSHPSPPATNKNEPEPTQAHPQSATSTVSGSGSTFCQGDHEVGPVPRRDGTFKPQQIQCNCRWADKTDSTCSAGQDIERRLYETKPENYALCDVVGCGQKLVWKRSKDPSAGEPNTLYIVKGSSGIDIPPAEFCPCSKDCGAVICQKCRGNSSGAVFQGHVVWKRTNGVPANRS